MELTSLNFAVSTYLLMFISSIKYVYLLVNYCLTKSAYSFQTTVVAFDGFEAESENISVGLNEN